MIKWFAFLPVGLVSLWFFLMLAFSIRIAEDFHARISDLQWILNAYTITMVVLLVLAGRIGDMVRRDRYFVFGMGIFVFGSFLCAQSWNVGSLIVFRILQAVGGAILSGNTLAIVT